MGDQNPIPYLILAAASRFWLAMIVAGQTALTGVPNDYLDWLGVFTIGIVASFPVIVNIIIALGVNGSLILWLALLIKRLLNPVAN